jgi:hypothetical protein
LAKNLPQHINCSSHIKAAGEERAKQETKELLDWLHAQDLKQLQRSEYQYVPLLHSRQLKVPVPTKRVPEIGKQEMWDEFDLN